MADTLKDVVAALCQVARDYSQARSRVNKPAVDNWRHVFAVVLESRLNAAGRGAALAAFRAEDCPGVDRTSADELAPPPAGTASLSGQTLRWLAKASGTDLVSLVPPPARAMERYEGAVAAPRGLSAVRHAAASSAAREALTAAATPPGSRVDVPLALIGRMLALAEAGIRSGAALGQSQNPWPRGTRERELWGLAKQWELICREQNRARTTTGQAGQDAYERARREASNFNEQVTEFLTAPEIAWVKRVGYELCALPKGATYSPPSIRIVPPSDRLVMGPAAPRPPIPAPRSQVTVPVSAPSFPWFPPYGAGLRVQAFPGIFL